MKKKITFIIIAILLSITIPTSIVLGVNGGGSDNLNNSVNKDPYLPMEPIIPIKERPLDFGRIGQSFVDLGYVERNIPREYKNEGLLETSRYPTYGNNNRYDDIEERKKIIEENLKLQTTLIQNNISTYDSMDEYGNLLLNKQRTTKKLYKHTGSQNMYYGEISPKERAVIRAININNIRNDSYITGLYAAPGEVIKIEISEEDLTNLGGSLEIWIGQLSAKKGEQNNIWEQRGDFVRMPLLGNKFKITTTTSYVGYHLGGPIYIYSPAGKNINYTVKISGALKYQTFIPGLTTKQEFNELKNTTVPYFDFEIWDNKIRHSGSYKYAKFSYEQLTNAATYWDKVTTLSKLLPATSSKENQITMLYDPFIAAGGAVAFLGRNWTNCPQDWLQGALDYNSLMNYGAWGQMHEYNHHFQNFGIQRGGEVTNNAASLLSYYLYTKISSNRTYDDNWNNDWGRYTDPTRGLRESIAKNKQNQPNDALEIYANLIHTFGSEIMIEVFNNPNQGNATNFYRALSDTLPYDFTWYFRDFLKLNLDQAIVDLYKEENRPNFVPVFTIYQTGRSFKYKDKELVSQTVRPFVIPYGKEFLLDFEKRLILPDEFEYEIIGITEPEGGTLTKVKNSNNYIYKPNLSTSKTFYLELKLTKKDDPNFNIDNVKIAIELVSDKKWFDAKEYTYTNDKMYRNLVVADANNYAGGTETVLENQSLNLELKTNNSIKVIYGKIYIPKTGKYRIGVRGRDQINLYVNINSNENLKYKAYIKGHTQNYDNTKSFEMKLEKGDYLYFKMSILRNSGSNAWARIGWANLDENESLSDIENQYLLNLTSNYEKEELFQTPYYFRTTYYLNQVTKMNNTKMNIVSSKFTPHDNNYKVEHLVDQNYDTVAHTRNYINSDSPVELVLDRGKYHKSFDTLNLVLRNKNEHAPRDFKIYGSDDNQNFDLIKDIVEYDGFLGKTESPINLGKDYNYRYVKIEITKTRPDNGDLSKSSYVCLREIELYKSIYIDEKIEDSKIVNLNSKSVFLTNGVIEDVNYNGFFGNEFIIKDEKSYVEFKFTGKVFGIEFFNTKEIDFKIVIDGKEEIVKANNINSYVRYINTNLDDKEHIIKIYKLDLDIKINYLFYK